MEKEIEKEKEKELEKAQEKVALSNMERRAEVVVDIVGEKSKSDIAEEVKGWNIRGGVGSDVHGKDTREQEQEGYGDGYGDGQFPPCILLALNAHSTTPAQLLFKRIQDCWTEDPEVMLVEANEIQVSE